MSNSKTSTRLTTITSNNFLTIAVIIRNISIKNISHCTKGKGLTFYSLNNAHMTVNYNSEIEKTIKDYIELQEMSRLYYKKKNDLEKEYNKLLTNSNGEEKNYNLEQADKIYKTYCEMIACEEQSKIADQSFNEAENKLKEIGRILYEATIHAEISLPAINGDGPRTKSVMVSYNNGQVYIR